MSRSKKEIPKYGIFIIESMDLTNEKNENLDGLVLSKILKLCGIPYDYYYIRTTKEFRLIIDKFKESNFGFLHLACHGTENGLSLCCDFIDFEELHEILGDHLKYRRLFLSVCQAARFELAQFFIPHYHCYSVIGTPNEIDYDKAAIFWSSFYYLMYFNNQERMFQFDILPTLKSLTKTFQINLNYFSIIKDSHPKSINHLRAISIDNGDVVSDKVKKTDFQNKYRKKVSMKYSNKNVYAGSM